MSTRALRMAAAAGATAAVTSVVTALMVPAGLLSEDATASWNTIDLSTDVLLIAGLAGFAAAAAARGWLGGIGLTLAFAGLGVFTLAGILGFSNPEAGESLHPISVPLTGVGMLLTGIATLRTHRWSAWRRFAPLLCGVVPFAIELPGFIAFGDSSGLYYFIACTWTAWLILFAALWVESGETVKQSHVDPMPVTG